MPDDPPSLRELQRAKDERTLLPGEDPSSTYLEDALHWLRVYEELITVKASLLDRTADALEGLTDDACEDLDVDQRLLRAQAARYKSRQRYWLHRVTELANGRSKTSPPDSHLHVLAAGGGDGAPGGSPPDG